MSKQLYKRQMMTSSYIQ